MDEEQLILKAQEGDQAALAELVKRYEKTVYSFSFKICRDRDKAEHTMQETFISMVRSLKQFDRKSKLSTWLYRIVMNHCLMLARGKKHEFVTITGDDEQLFDDALTVSRGALPSSAAENSELRAILDAAISKLPPDYRSVFTLRDIEELSNEETAKLTGLTVAAVKSRLHRARAFLRNEITGAYKQ